MSMSKLRARSRSGWMSRGSFAGWGRLWSVAMVIAVWLVGGADMRRPDHELCRDPPAP